MLVIAIQLVAATLVSATCITGTVVYEGRAPKMQPVQVNSDPKCAALHAKDDPPKHDWLLLDENQNLANVLVQVVKGLPDEEYPEPTEPVVLTQQGCQYSPHVFVLRPGQTLQVLNPDDTLHNIHFLPAVNSEYNKSMPESRKEMEHSFSKPEPVFPIKCDVHAWMKAYCAVLEHPYHALTGKDGTYALPQLPPGKYTLEFWHEKLGTQTREVTVTEGESLTVDAVFTRPQPTR